RPGAEFTSVAASADGRTLATADTAGTALVWDGVALARRDALPPKALTAAELEQAWVALGAGPPAEAVPAGGALEGDAGAAGGGRGTRGRRWRGCRNT